MTPRRIQLRRTKGWRMPDRTIKVDRTTMWGNPFRVGDPCVPDAAAALAWYRACVRNDPGMRWRMIRAGVADLRGYNLACWCPLDAPCHADVLLELANQ